MTKACSEVTVSIGIFKHYVVSVSQLVFIFALAQFFTVRDPQLMQNNVNVYASYFYL